MLVEAESNEDIYLVALPLVLRKDAVCRSCLFEVALGGVVDVIEVVVVVLRTYGKLRGQTSLIIKGVLRTAYCSKVGGCAVCIGVHIGAKIA